ncbi:MAG: patatin family protein [Bulleidia sp.]
MKTGLIMEGGAMRGMFTAGVTDVLMHEEIVFDGAIGVSAGATFGCNVKSRQIGRALRYNMAYCRDPRYCSIGSWLFTGDLYNSRFDYHEIPYQRDIWDQKTFAENPMEFWCVATDAKTGEPLYHRCTDGGETDLKWIQGSASLPLAAKSIHIDGYELLDGGISDSVPYRYFESIGYDRNVVILTQPADYRKKPYGSGLMKVMEKKLKAYPAVIDRLYDRHERYNAEIADIVAQEKAGEVFVIRPPEALNIGSVCHKPKELRRVYDIGVDTARKNIDELREFLKQG